MTAPKVFISYSHESTEHDEWVLGLAQSLRQHGVDASLDRWDLIPGSDMTVFMESRIRDSDYVVLVCTPMYATKSNVPLGGVGYERGIISAEMLQARDLRPKFIPLLRRGDFNTALPTYLGSRYAIDHRDGTDPETALDELLRAIHRVDPTSKPPLGQSPFLGASSASGVAPETLKDVGQWEKEARGRFDYLRQTRISKDKVDPFERGHWQASFLLLSDVPHLDLNQFLSVVEQAPTGRTGWDIGWVPTRAGIARYPFKDGIEAWLAEDGGGEPGFSDFWRSEPSGRFSLIRGYQDDDSDFREKHPDIGLDFGIVLWRVAEVLLYLESFASHIGTPDSAASVRFTWGGLNGRQLESHDMGFQRALGRWCHQDSVTSSLAIPDCTLIRRRLIDDVHALTLPLLAAFDFFSIKPEYVANAIRKLFDPDKELSPQA